MECSSRSSNKAATGNNAPATSVFNVATKVVQPLLAVAGPEVAPTLEAGRAAGVVQLRDAATRVVQPPLADATLESVTALESVSAAKGVQLTPAVAEL